MNSKKKFQLLLIMSACIIIICFILNIFENRYFQKNHIESTPAWVSQKLMDEISEQIKTINVLTIETMDTVEDDSQEQIEQQLIGLRNNLTGLAKDTKSNILMIQAAFKIQLLCYNIYELITDRGDKNLDYLNAFEDKIDTLFKTIQKEFKSIFDKLEKSNKFFSDRKRNDEIKDINEIEDTIKDIESEIKKLVDDDIRTQYFPAQKSLLSDSNKKSGSEKIERILDEIIKKWKKIDKSIEEVAPRLRFICFNKVDLDIDIISKDADQTEENSIVSIDAIKSGLRIRLSCYALKIKFLIGLLFNNPYNVEYIQKEIELLHENVNATLEELKALIINHSSVSDKIAQIKDELNRFKNLIEKSLNERIQVLQRGSWNNGRSGSKGELKTEKPEFIKYIQIAIYILLIILLAMILLIVKTSVSLEIESEKTAKIE